MLLSGKTHNGRYVYICRCHCSTQELGQSENFVLFTMSSAKLCKYMANVTHTECVCIVAQKAYALECIYLHCCRCLIEEVAQRRGGAFQTFLYFKAL